jgi:hypothetical protein
MGKTRADYVKTETSGISAVSKEKKWVHYTNEQII